MYKFLLQLEENGHYSEDVAVVERIIRERNWLHQEEDPILVDSCCFKELSKERVADTIPVGSIEFVNKVLSLGYNAGHMKPINIPKELFDKKYLGRQCAIVKDKNDIQKLYSVWDKRELFIKSHTAVKTGYTDFYKISDNLPDDTEYFVSEVVNLVSEWRCFVYRGVLKDIKNYSGDPWVLPYREFVQECIDQIGDSITAYTLDVGVTSDGKTVVIEVHNFVSCGLYGFDNPAIIPMLVNGIKREISK